MRVLFLSDVYFPRINGVSTSIATFRADLAACGVETTLVAPDYDSLSRQVAPAERVAEVAEGIVRVAAARVPGDPEDRRMRWKALGRALDSLSNERFDLIHVHTPFVALYAGIGHARRQRIPCVATWHTHFEEYLHQYVPILPRPIGRTLARSFTRSQARCLDALIAPSAPMRDVLERYRVAAPVHVVPTGLSPDRFARGDGEQFRARLGIRMEQPLLLYVGRVAYEKNIEFLIRCFARVRLAMPDAVLAIAGEGPAEGTLKRFVRRLGLEAAIRFTGYLDRERALLDCYAAADVFVFASRTETQGLVLLEAMAQGAPIVSTAALGTRSILKQESGAIVVAEREKEFAAAAVRVLENAELRRDLASRGRAYAESWSSRAMARRLAALYRDVCAETEESSSLDWAPPSPDGDGDRFPVFEKEWISAKSARR
ncbi:MAG TPA: glycosyltransferase [Steroidobacteraceae bacterium]|nr:glycosyltransferase [Steroidobacteraceae bacterium]